MQKNSKNKKIPLWRPFKLKQVGKGREKEKIKIIITFRSYPTRNLKFQQNSKKIKKKNKSTIMALFQAKIGWKMQRKRENKNCHSVPFRSYSLRNRKFQKKQQIQKIKKHHYGFI